MRQAYDYRQDQPGFYRIGRAKLRACVGLHHTHSVAPALLGRRSVRANARAEKEVLLRARARAAVAPRPHFDFRESFSVRFEGTAVNVPSSRGGSSSENTREEAGRPDARESAALGRGGSAARARGGRALPEASLESVLGGEGRGAQPRTERPAEGARRVGESTRRMRAAFGAELWDRPGQAQALYWGRTGFCEWVECASGGRREARRGSARDAQRVTMQTSARALG